MFPEAEQLTTRSNPSPGWGTGSDRLDSRHFSGFAEISPLGVYPQVSVVTAQPASFPENWLRVYPVDFRPCVQIGKARVCSEQVFTESPPHPGHHCLACVTGCGFWYSRPRLHAQWAATRVPRL